MLCFGSRKVQCIGIFFTAQKRTPLTLMTQGIFAGVFSEASQGTFNQLDTYRVVRTSELDSNRE